LTFLTCNNGYGVIMFLYCNSTAGNSIADLCNKSAIKLKMAKWYVDLSWEAFRISICYRSDAD